MSDKLRILLAEAGSIHNKGDAAIFFTIYNSLRKKFPKAKFVALADEPKSASKLYGIEAFYAPYAVPYKGVRWTKILFRAIRFILWAIFYKLTGKYFFLSDIEKQSLKQYEKANVVISSGGNALTDDYIGTLYFFLEIFWIVKVIFKKPLIIYAYSVGPFKYRLYKMLARYILNKADLITLREDISKKVVKELKITRPKLIVAADSAFLFWSAPKRRAKQIMRKEKLHKLKRPLIGISVREWNFRGEKNPKEKYEKYKLSVARVADHAIDKYNANVIFISTCFKGGKHNYTDDSIVAKDITKLMNHKKNVTVFTTEYDPQEIKSVIGQMDLFIGTRAHSTIFAITSYLPTIGLAYEFKTHGFLRLMGIEKYACYMKDVHPEKLIQLFDDLWKNRKKIRKTLKRRLPIVKKRANISADVSKRFIDDYESSSCK